jgi:23S rRNA (guanosine2251-2'-O)-methyltransferase
VSRRASEAALVYGRNSVREALRGRRRVFAVRGLEKELGALRAEIPPGVQVSPVGRAELDELAGSPDHQGLVAEVEPYPYADPDALLAAEDAFVLALDRLQDPQNLGAVCRSAEGAGASGVVLPERGAATITPAVSRASAGAVEHLPVARVRNLADYLVGAKRAGAWVYGAEAGAETPYTAPDYEGRVVLVLGSEGRGLRPRVRAACDVLVSVPLLGRIESLNASAAATLLLYEAARRRRDGCSDGGDA